MGERQYGGSVERLRAPERMRLLEVGHVVDLCLAGEGIATVLDVGTGSGLFAEEFDRRGLTVSGIDVSPAMVAAARRYVPRGHFTEAPADALPFNDGAFDLVFLGHVLHEVDDARRALAEARRVARVRVVVLKWPYRREEAGPPLAHRLPPDEIDGLARAAGFRSIEALPLAHMALYRLTSPTRSVRRPSPGEVP